MRAPGGAGRAVTIGLSFCGLLAAAAPALAAQGALTVARARVDASSGTDVRVELDYTVRVDSAAAIPFEGLAFRPTELREVTVRGESAVGAFAPDDFSWSVAGNGRLTASLPLAPGTEGPVRVRLSYDVAGAREGADPWRFRIPVLAPVWPAPEAFGETFAAELLFPAGWTVYETFPSGVTRSPGTGTLATHTLQLPVVPALLSLRATAGTPPLGGIIQFLDMAVVIVLGVLAFAAWLHFRRPV